MTNIKSADEDQDLRTWTHVFAADEIGGERKFGALSGDVMRTISSISDSHRMPLSFAQERLWFLDQLEPGGNGYLIRVALRLTGTLDVPALEAALSALAARHEVLRTRFMTDEAGRPYQLIDPPGRVPVRIADLTGRDPETVTARIEEAASAPFDLARGPLLRTVLVRTGPDEAVLVICLHHIVFDGWSEIVFARELRALYTAALDGTAAALPEPPIRYADHAVAERRRLTGDRLRERLDYWRDRLAGLQPLQLPTDRPRGAARGGREGSGDVVAFTLPAATVTALRAVAGRARASLFMGLLAGFQVLLSRYSGQDDIAVGTPIAGRHRPETEDLIGLFVNSLVLRTDLSGDPTFTELLGRVKETALGAYDHQDLPFERLVEELAPQRDLSRNPLFQAMLVLQTTPGSKIWKLPGLDISHAPLQATDPQVDLTFDLTQQDDRSIKAFIYFSRDLFDRATIERMAGHYRALLDRFAADPATPLSRIGMLTGAERRRILIEWNATEAPLPAVPTLHGMVAERAATWPDEPAVVCGDEVLTYRRLDARANQLAHHLRARGIGPEVPVGVFLDRSPDLIVALLGVLKAGGAYVPLDPDHPAERLAYMLDDTAAPLVITHEALAARLPERTARLPIDTEWPASCPETAPVPSAGPRNLAYVIYTSGSTGRPKGVMIEHQGVVAYLAGMQDAFPLRPGDGFLQATPLTFDVSAYEIFWPLWQGGTVVLVPGSTRLDMAHVGSLMRRHRVVGLHFVPSLMDLFAGQVDPADCAGLRYAFCSGEALPETLVRRFTERFGGDLINLYGATEVSVDTTFWRATPDSPVLAGRPMSNQTVYVLDESLRPVPIGAVGEVYLGGRCVGRGYQNRPGLTADRFPADPFTGRPGERMYKTGDLGRFTPDGDLVLLGRIDGQVKLRGVRIEPGEIEAVLLTHRDVAACAVAAWEDDMHDKQLVAYCVPAAGDLDIAEIRDLCRRELPAVMVPAVFMTLPALPLNSNSKVDRKRLPAPEPGDLAPGTGYVAPRDEIEQALAEVWADLLGLDRVGVHDDFFEVGGHSLRAVQLINQVERLTGIRLSLRDLFSSPSIAGIKTRLLALIDPQE